MSADPELPSVWEAAALAGERSVPLAAGAILLHAAGLKLRQSVHTPMSPLAARGLLALDTMLIACGIFLGLWLISGSLPTAARRVAIGCFGSFACYTLFEALAGKTDCGCFGQVHVNPWYTAILDVATALALVFPAKPAVMVFRKQQNLHFVSQNHPRRTYILWKARFAEWPSGIGPETVTYGQSAS
jgi:hypothetical protein